MVVALLVLSLAMIVGGLFTVFLGWDIILVERGWAMVIAGSTAAGSGAVLLGITAAVGRLGRIRSELAALRDQMAQAAAAMPPPPILDPVAAVSSGFMAEQAAAPERDAQDELQPGLPLFMRPAGHRDPEPTGPVPSLVDLEERLRASEESPAEAPARPVAEEPSDEPTKVSTGFFRRFRASPRPEEARPFQAPPRPFEEPPRHLEERARDTGEDEGAGALEEPADRVPDSSGADEPSSSSVVVFRREPPLKEPDEEAPTEHKPSFASLDDEPPARPVEAEAPLSPAMDVEPETAQPEPEVTSAPAGPATVIGTYNSGDNRYVMFSDGSIEAETPGGIFRFQSLDELKEFIAAGGEGGSGSRNSA